MKSTCSIEIQAVLSICQASQVFVVASSAHSHFHGPAPAAGPLTSEAVGWENGSSN
jgi:hypothetical protein